MFDAIRVKLSRILFSKEEILETLDMLAITNPEKYRRILAVMSEKEVAEYMNSTLNASLRDGVSLTEIKVVDEVVQLRVVPKQDIIDPNYHWKPGMEHQQPKPPAKKRRPEVFDRPAMNRQARRKADAVARRKADGKDKA